MKAVNLIPPEEQRGGPGGAGRTGGAVYALLGALGVIVIAIAAYVLTANSVNDRRSEASRVSREAAVAQAQAGALRPYRDFAQLRQARVQTVSQLASNRFDWERTLRDLARVIPGDVWLTSLKATVSPSVQFDSGGATGGGGSAGDTGSIRGSQQVPAIEIVGCTTAQAEVAHVLTRMRLIQDVSHVTLVESAKSDSLARVGGGSGGGAGNDDCRHGSARYPRFQLVAFFKPLTGAAPGATPGTTGSTPPASGAGAGSAPPSSRSTAPTSTLAPSSAHRAAGTSSPAPGNARPAPAPASGASR